MFCNLRQNPRMEIDNVPDVVQRIIFKHLGSKKSKNESKTWKMGSFYPPGIYFEQKTNAPDDTLEDKLKFCLIFPNFIDNLDIDLNQERFMTHNLVVIRARN